MKWFRQGRHVGQWYGINDANLVGMIEGALERGHNVVRYTSAIAAGGEPVFVEYEIDLERMTHGCVGSRKVEKFVPRIDIGPSSPVPPGIIWLVKVDEDNAWQELEQEHSQGCMKMLAEGCLSSDAPEACIYKFTWSDDPYVIDLRKKIQQNVRTRKERDITWAA